MSRLALSSFVALIAVSAVQGFNATPGAESRDTRVSASNGLWQAEARAEPELKRAPAVGVWGDETIARIGDGSSASGSRWLNDKLVTQADWQCTEPAMVVTPDGRMYIAVEDHAEHDGWATVMESLDGGDTWTWRVSFRTATAARNPALAYGERASGTQWLYLVYEATMTDNSKRIMSIRFDPRTLDWDPVAITGDLPAVSDIHPRVCTDNNLYDNFYVYVVYVANAIDYYPAMFSRSTDWGESFQAPINVTGGSESSTFIPRPDIAYGSGGLFIAFEKPGWTGSEWDTQVWVTRSGNYGVSWGAPLQLTTNNEGAWHPAVAAASGAQTVLVAYTYGFATDDDLRYAYSGDGGATYFYNQILPWTYDEERSISLGASASNGRFHAAWWRNYDIVYSSASVAPPLVWSPTMRVNEENYASSIYTRPAIYSDPMRPLADEACVAWTDFRDGSYVVYFDAGFRSIGDMNCDGVITVSDIAGFVLALTDAPGYAAAFPDCDIHNADTNGDGAVTVSDIGPFVALLTGS